MYGRKCISNIYTKIEMCMYITSNLFIRHEPWTTNRHFYTPKRETTRHFFCRRQMLNLRRKRSKNARFLQVLKRIQAMPDLQMYVETTKYRQDNPLKHDNFSITTWKSELPAWVEKRREASECAFCIYQGCLCPHCKNKSPFKESLKI